MKKVKTGTVVSDCKFVAVEFDESAVNAIQSIADGLIENAKGLRALAEVLRGSNITIETMLKIGE